MLTTQAVLTLATASMGQVCNTYNSITALSGMINAFSSSTLGNYYNYWKLTDNDTTYDLTRSDRMPVSTPKTIPMIGSRERAIIEPNRTALVIVDMQNFFLHPQLSPAADKGRAAVQPTLNMIDAFRANEMKVLWVQWGIDNYDLLTMPPALLDQFSDDHSLNSTFCTEMGTIQEEDGTEVDLGKKLCRGSWNAQPYGPLYPAMLKGTANGTDYYFNKSECLSCYSYWYLCMLTRRPRSALWPLGRSDSSGSVSSGIWNYYSFRRSSTRRKLHFQIRTKPLTGCL